MAFDSKYALNDAIRYLTKVAERRAAGGWVPPKERERQQRDAMRQEQQQARQAEKQQQAQQKQFIADEKERQKNLAAFQKGNHPDVPHVLYHGTGSEHDGDFRVPSFFTSDPQGAEWYAKNRGDNPQIFPVHLSMKKPLDTRSKEGIFKLINIAHNAGVHVELKETPKGWQFTSNDIAKHSPYEGDNPLDLLYIPKVRNALYQNGHDGVIASDVLSNDEIPTFIPLHSQQIKSATGNQGTFNPSASDITKSEGGPILSKQFPTQYMPNVGRQVMNTGGTPDQPQRQLSPMGFYSAAAERASTLQPSGNAVQMVNALKNAQGIKTEELRNAGLIDESGNVHPDWAGRGKVTRDELVSHLQRQMPQVEETVLGYNKNIPGWEIVNQDGKYMLRRPDGSFHTAPNSDIPATWSNETAAQAALNFNAKDSSSATKYSQYTLPGGENYREVLLRLPDKRPEVFMVNADSLSKEFSSLQEAENYKKAIMDSYPNAPAPNIKKIKTLDPQKDGFRSQHWNDPNVLAHIRMSDRIGPNGEKILHVEELQSDWGQKGKKEGFASSAPVSKFKIGDMAGFNAEYNDFFNKWLLSSDNQSLGVIKQNKKGKYTPEVILRQGVGHNLGEFNTPEEALNAVKNLEVHGHKQTHSLNEIPIDAEKLTAMYLSKDEAEKAAIKHGIPSAPYVTSTEGWTDLALKRVLKEAAEGGYDKIVWTPGAEQAKRYDLSRHVDRVEYQPETKTLIGIKDGKPVFDQTVEPQKIEDYVGKDVAKKLLEQPITGEDMIIGGFHSLSGQDLSVGGEGMKGYYDNIVPKRLQAIAKKHDKNAKVGYTDIMLPAARRKGSNNPPIQAPGIDITPEMRESILRGQSAYKRGGQVSKRHPALSIAGTHIREETHGEPIFTGRL